MLATVKTKGAEAASRRNLRVRLALERLTGKPLDRSDFQSQAMKDGIEREPDAFAAYEALTGRLLERTGFLRHERLQAGASLDGHCDDFTGLVEIKCPEHAAHLEVLESGTLPAKYLPQVTHQLWATGAAWLDFVSYQPDFPIELRIKVVRVDPQPADIDAYELALALFLSEVELETERIRALAQRNSDAA